VGTGEQDRGGRLTTGIVGGEVRLGLRSMTPPQSLFIRERGAKMVGSKKDSGDREKGRTKRGQKGANFLQGGETNESEAPSCREFSCEKVEEYTTGGCERTAIFSQKEYLLSFRRSWVRSERGISGETRKTHGKERPRESRGPVRDGKKKG